MDNYLIDRETLSQFVDELIKKKPLPTNDPEEQNNIREQAIKSLNDQIGLAIFGQFTQEQNDVFNQLLDRDATEDEYQTFFDRTGIDIEKTVNIALQDFANDFIGGQNG